MLAASRLRFSDGRRDCTGSCLRSHGAVAVLDRRARALAGFVARRGDECVIGRELADRVGRALVAGQLERLAAAAAEVDRPALAARARLFHPRFAAEVPEALRLEPGLPERAI